MSKVRLVVQHLTTTIFESEIPEETWDRDYREFITKIRESNANEFKDLPEYAGANVKLVDVITVEVLQGREDDHQG